MRVWRVPRRVACGVWRVQRGVWRVACGVWRVACGGWRVAGGVWRMCDQKTALFGDHIIIKPAETSNHQHLERCRFARLSIEAPAIDV